MTFKDVYTRNYIKMCSRASFILKDIELAKDIVHDVFIKFWNHKYDGTDKQVWSILNTMVNNACLDSIGKEKALPFIDGMEIEDSFSNTMILADVELSLVADVNYNLKCLPTKCREVFDLYFTKGKTTEQIVFIMKISKQNVLNQKQRALQLLRTAMLIPEPAKRGENSRVVKYHTVKGTRQIKHYK